MLQKQIINHLSGQIYSIKTFFYNYVSIQKVQINWEHPTPQSVSITGLYCGTPLELLSKADIKM